MIVIARSYGQLGNRLFLYAHFIAAAREYDVELANPCFAEYAHLFPSTAKDLWCRYPQRTISCRHQWRRPPSPRKRRALAKSTYLAARALSGLRLTNRRLDVLRIRGDQSYDLGSEEFAELTRGNRRLLTLGWLFRSERLLAKHADAVRAHFQIASTHRKKIGELMGSIRLESDMVVGVHIRHGDYATFMNGKYFYTVNQYADVMRDIAGQFAGKRVAFLVCSNANVNRNDFAGLRVHFGPGHIIEDMYAMADADLLVGPPSTYTGWASFYGEVPLVAMPSGDDPIDLSVLRSDPVNRVA